MYTYSHISVHIYDRRDAMLRRYDVSSVLLSDRMLANNSWVVRGRRLLPKCPNGTFAEGAGCQQCPANASSPAGAGDRTACQCDADFFLEVVNDDWVCTHCGPNARSRCGSTLRSDCKCNPGYVGRDGGTCTPCPLNTYKALV